MFSDKTSHNIKMSRVITFYLQFIAELYDVIKNNVDYSKLDKEKRASIEDKYQKIIDKRGAGIKKIGYITREEEYPYLYENTDFSPAGIKNLIKEGEEKTKQTLKEIGF
jgi:NTE family protein